MKSSSLKNKFPEQRIYGFDLIRFFSVCAIIIFHSYETLIFKDEIPTFLDNSLYSYIQHYARLLTVSGFYIVALSSFLIGFRQNQKWGHLLGLATIGFFLLAWVEADDLKSNYLFEWDIYPFLLTAWTPLFFAKKNVQAIKVMGFIGFVLLSFPFWKFLEFKNNFLQIAFFGSCHNGQGQGWPLFPWIGIVWGFFFLGFFLKRNSQAFFNLKSFSSREKWMWGFLLFPSIFHLGAYYRVPIGPGFSCFVFRRSLTDFWAHMIFLLFAMRISLLENVNLWLKKFDLIQRLSALYWSQHFGICYIAHFFILGIFSIPGYNFYSQHPHLFDMVVVLTFPLTELLCRFCFQLIKLTQAARFK